ncbi:serine--tRNA ligase [Candidatus Woesearchaeota archaeon]|nr:serine--tRNA ligase [Candidatus Woesearchaeota archaeon]
MLDIDLFRKTPQVVRADLRKRKDTEKLLWVDKILSLDVEWKKLKSEAELLRNTRNVLSREIAQLKKEKKDMKDVTKKLKEAADIPKQIDDLEHKQEDLRKQIDNYLLRMPNILHPNVPAGAGEEDNKIEKAFGKKPSFSFTPKSHVNLITDLNIADIERAAKISGARFWFLKGNLALLDAALQKYAIDFMHKRRYTLLRPPFMMNRASYEGVTDLGDFEQVMYKIDNEDLYLIATSEHPMTAMFMDEILDEKDLPIKFCGVSECFRKEAGAHGKDTKGIFRGHQFTKIEQVVICKPEESWDFHEELIKNAQDFFTSLGLHFRRVSICTGDIGTVAAKKYDLEVWMPAQNTFREVVSCSNCTDYQSRRLKIRYRTPQGTVLVHTLNSTCVATSRALVAILENFQQKDGSIKVPDVLVPYMNGVSIIKKHVFV